MDEPSDLPKDQAERALALQELLVTHATGGSESNDHYALLRREFMEQATTRDLLPRFVRTCRTLETFWGWIKSQSPKWEPRRVLIRSEFAPLLDHLEGRNAVPADKDISTALKTFDAEGVHRAWEKALERRRSDPEGAITSARTLVETVCKRVLDEAGATYAEDEDLPKLYRAVAETLALAPTSQTEPVFKSILGSCQNIVNNLGTLRNKIGDAHGKGGRPVRASARHAALVVNLAGAMATFLVETYSERQHNPRSAP
jgi:Abortive infection C-terminus